MPGGVVIVPPLTTTDYYRKAASLMPTDWRRLCGRQGLHSEEPCCRVDPAYSVRTVARFD